MKEKTADIDILEELKNKQYTNKDILGNLVLSEEEYTAISTLISENKELEEKNKELQKYMKEYLIPKSTINLVYIPKSKVQGLIDEINKAYENSKDEYGESEYYYPDYTIEKLQSLLGKE